MKNAELPKKFLEIAKSRSKKNHGSLPGIQHPLKRTLSANSNRGTGGLSKVIEGSSKSGMENATKTDPVRKKKVNYLEDVRKEMRLQKNVNDWEKIVTKNQNSKLVLDDYHKILIEAEKLEKEAKQKEVFLRNVSPKNDSANPRAKLGLEDQGVDDLYCNSIKAKLAVLKEL